MQQKKYRTTSKKQRGAAIFLISSMVLTVFFSLTQKTEAATTCTYPSQILDLANWKETLPTGSSGSPTEILQASLASYSQNPYFMPNAACDGVIFRAPVNGVTTSGSGYPRSELREMTNGGKSTASWSTASGIHSMYIDEAITAVPKTKKHIVAGQIHDANDDVIVIRLEYPKLFVDINGTTGPTLDANYTLGKRFTVQFISANNQTKIYYNGNQTPAYTLNKSGSGYYFKAGAYTQSNCSKETVCDSSNFGEVTIYNLKVQHSDANINPILISAPSQTTTFPPSYDNAIYRFWSDTKQGHFFTSSVTERNSIIANDKSWSYEGAAYNSCSANASGATPIHRFWNSSNQHHFYTASVDEKNSIIANDKSWSYEGVSYYAYASQQPNSTAVYRFWSDSRQGHFFTASSAEKDSIIAKDKSWKYEGVAWYVPTS